MFGLPISFPGQTTKEQQSLISHVRVQHDTEVEDHQPDENHNNKVEIEEHFVEVQEGPLLDENYGDNENSLYNQLNMAE